MTWSPPGAPGGWPVLAQGLPPPKFDRGRGRNLLIIAVAAVAVLGVALVIGVVAFVTESAEGSALTLVLAAVPMPILVWAYLWLDRYEPEPMRFLVSALVWGAVVSVLIAGFLEFAAGAWLDASTEVLAVGVAPGVEEGAKGLFLLLILVRRRAVVGGILNGIIYAGLVGVGFAFTENVLYYAGAYGGSLDPALQGAPGATGVFIVRGLFSPFAHPLFTSATGIGIALGVVATRRWVRWAAPVFGFAVAVGLHTAWNGTAMLADDDELPKEFLLTYLLAMLPLLGAGIALAGWARAREGRVLSRSLADAARRGWLHPAEIHWLVRLGDRGAARRFAEQVAGSQAAIALRAYQEAAPQMAFMHDRVLRGTAPPDGVHQVLAHLRRMRSWRPFVVLPPITWSSSAGDEQTGCATPAEPVPSD